MMWLLMLACSSVPESLLAQRKALDAYRQAEVALASGAVDEALKHIDTAISKRPRDPLLVAWRASVIARSDPKQAADDLEVLLAAHPDFAIARYNRAAYLARAGRMFDAAPELERALADGVASVDDVRADPDFAPHLQHPALNFLPLPELTATLGRLPARAFRDAEVPVVVRIGTAEAATVAGAVVGPVEVVSAVEDVRSGERVITWTLRAVSPGQVAVGPISVRSGALHKALPAGSFEVVGPLDAAQGEAVTLQLPQPSDPAYASPTGIAVRHNGGVLVRTDAVSKVTVEPSMAPRFLLEQRADGQTKSVTRVYPDAVTSVRVRAAGGEIFSGAPRLPTDASEH